MSDPITTSEAAKILDLSESGVRALERSGRLNAARTGTGMRIFSKAEVQRVAAARAAKQEPRSA